MKNVALLVLIAVILAIFVSCSANNKFLGEWYMNNTGAVAIFNKDSTCKFAVGGMSVGKQTYSIKDDQIIISSSVMGINTDMAMGFKFSKDNRKLTLTFKGQNIELTRKE